MFSIEARALGFSPGSRAVRLGGGDTLRLDFALQPVVPELAPVVVTVPEDPLPIGIMRAFEERRRMGIGRFITRDMLDEREHDTVSGILRGLAGVRMVRRPGSCGGSCSAATGRGSAVGSQVHTAAPCAGVAYQWPRPVI